MILTKEQVDKIINISIHYINHPYDKRTFNCLSFVRIVYSKAGIDIPVLGDFILPTGLNLSKEERKEFPKGHLLFLKDRNDSRKNRFWTHVVICLDKRQCIHCSRFYGEKVIISSIDEIIKDKYDFVD